MSMAYMRYITMQTDTVTLNQYFSLSTCATIVSKVALYWCQYWFVMDLKSNIFLSCNSCLLDWSLIILSGQLSHSIATRSPSCFMRRVSCFKNSKCVILNDVFSSFQTWYDVFLEFIETKTVIFTSLNPQRA